MVSKSGWLCNERLVISPYLLAPDLTKQFAANAEVYQSTTVHLSITNACTTHHVLKTSNPIGKHTSRFMPRASLINCEQAFRAATRATRPLASVAPRFLTPMQMRMLSDDMRQAIDKAVASAPVVLFMKGTPETPQCGFSRASIQILGMQGVDPEKFTAFNVLEDNDLRSGMLALLSVRHIWCGLKAKP
jgi:hypothetical protein